MKALIVYDSYFGNTEKIAQAVTKAMQPAISVDLVKIDQAQHSMLEGVDFFIIASPTRAFNPTPAVKSFLKKIPANGLSGIRVAAFDTRIRMGDNVPGFLQVMVKMFGYADKPMHDLLLKKGGQAIVPSQGFFVKDSEGPLQDGELERAEAWAKEIAER